MKGIQMGKLEQKSKIIYSEEDSEVSESDTNGSVFSEPLVSQNQVKKVQTMQLSQIQEMRDISMDLDYTSLVKQRNVRLRYFSHSKVDAKIYKKEQIFDLSNTFCAETRGQPDLLSQSALNFIHVQHRRDQDDINRNIKRMAQHSNDPNSLKKQVNTILDTKMKRQELNQRFVSGFAQNSRANQELKKPTDLPDDTIFTYDDVYLEEDYCHQSDEVLKFVLKGKEHFFKDAPDLLKKWIRCLPREERMAVEKDKTHTPMPDRIMMHKIDKGLLDLYGSGKYRVLRPGEEATIIEAFSKYLISCQTIEGFQKLAINNILKTLQAILTECKHSYLFELPLAIKQVECHWKIMATRFRCSQKMPTNQKNFEKYLNMSQMRGHYLQMDKKDNPLVGYLLRYASLRAEYIRSKGGDDKKNQQLKSHYFQKRDSKPNGIDIPQNAQVNQKIAIPSASDMKRFSNLLNISAFSSKS